MNDLGKDYDAVFLGLKENRQYRKREVVNTLNKKPNLTYFCLVPTPASSFFMLTTNR